MITPFIASTPSDDISHQESTTMLRSLRDYCMCVVMLYMHCSQPRDFTSPPRQRHTLHRGMCEWSFGWEQGANVGVSCGLCTESGY